MELVRYQYYEQYEATQGASNGEYKAFLKNIEINMKKVFVRLDWFLHHLLLLQLLGIHWKLIVFLKIIIDVIYVIGKLVQEKTANQQFDEEVCAFYVFQDLFSAFCSFTIQQHEWCVEELHHVPVDADFVLPHFMPAPVFSDIGLIGSSQ